MHAFVFGFVSLKRYRTGFIEAIKLECMCVCMRASVYTHLYMGVVHKCDSECAHRPHLIARIVFGETSVYAGKKHSTIVDHVSVPHACTTVNTVGGY